MSTLIKKKISPTEDILCGKYFIVQKERLGDAVKRIRDDKNLSLEDVRRKSGNTLATSYLNRIENNQVAADVISIGKLQALAKGLDEPIGKLIELALGIERRTSENEESLLFYAKELVAFRQRDLISIAKLFYNESQTLVVQTSGESNATSNNLKPKKVKHIGETGKQKSDKDKKVA